MLQDTQKLKTEIIARLDSFSLEGLQLLAEFVQFLWQRKTFTTTNVVPEQAVAPVADNAWGLLETCSGTIQAPADWSSEHNHYLYGTPKHQDGDVQ